MPNAENMTQILLLVAMVAGAYLLLIRPAQKRQKEAQKLLAEVGEGDRVLTSIGIFGNIKHLGETQAIIEVAPGVELTVSKQIIMKTVSPDDEEFEYED